MVEVQYRVLKNIWKSSTGQTYCPGDVISLTPDQARLLSGCVRLMDDNAQEMAPVTDVPGIGEERERGLAQMDIMTVADLANADPIEIELTMVNVSTSMIERWQAAARDLLGIEEVDCDG
jgi:nucleotidyltransferase/DNA polymerase involved in DNA repair